MGLEGITSSPMGPEEPRAICLILGTPTQKDLEAQAPPKATDYDAGMGGCPYPPGDLGLRQLLLACTTSFLSPVPTG